MSVLQHFPLLDQLSDTNEPNRQYDCVPTCIAACLEYLTGKSYDGGAVKDTVYGKGYVGGTDAARYVAYCAAQGVTLSPVSGNPGQLVQAIHQALAAGHGVLVTIPDIYVPSSYGWTHVVSPYEDSSSMITALDPYVGKPTTKSDQEWAQLLQFNQIWILSRKEEELIIDLSMPAIAAHFEAVADNPNAWRCKATGKIIKDGMLDWYRTCGAKPYGGFSILGLPKSNEQPLQGKAVKQFYERAVVAYDPEHRYGGPEGAGDVYLLQLYDGGPGTDPAIADLEAQLAALKTQSGDPALVASLQGKIAAAQKALA